MYIVIVLLLAALVGVWAMGRRTGGLALLQIGLAVAALGVLGYGLLRGPRSPVPAADPRIGEALGWRLGRAVAEAVPGGGAVVVVVNPAESAAEKVSLDAQRRGLEAGLGGGAFAVTVVDPSVVEADPPLPPGLHSLDSSFWLRLAPVLAAHREAAALVSLAGVPSTLGGAEGRDLPPVFAFEAGAPRAAEWAAQFAAGRLLGLAVARAGVPVGRRERGALEEVFDRHYEFFTAATFSGYTPAPVWREAEPLPPPE